MDHSRSGSVNNSERPTKKTLWFLSYKLKAQISSLILFTLESTGRTDRLEK
ncbi:MAG: hypothetical protein K0R66_826 [Gammaproteobacteria bacterium]|jgi:hypothetical protein|nr:hypothetical protein [Gammaproteobacteria bacterium]